MEGGNLVQFPNDRRKSPSSMMGSYVDRLIKRFEDGRKRQPEVFSRLSIFLEELENEVKQTYGARSGKLSEAYGYHYGKMKPRFSARDGVPPKQLFATPAGWIAVIRGFAKVLGRSEHSLLATALERAFDSSGSSQIGKPGDYREVSIILDALKEHISASGDLVAINEYVSRSGLYLENDCIQVAEWPWDAGFIDGLIYHEAAFDFVPKVFGINAATVAEVDLAPDDLMKDDLLFLAHMAADLEDDGAIRLLEARLIGLAIAVSATTSLPEVALLEWDRALAFVCDSEGNVIRTESVVSPIGNTLEIEAGFTGLGDGRSSPQDWHPGGIRIHFRHSDGFDRVMRSTLIRPWIWTELNPELWLPTPDTDFATFPVSAPAHTTAAAIEGNLLYADDADQPSDRLDRLLVKKVKEIEAALVRFKEEAEIIRRPRKDAILSEWGMAPLITPTSKKDD